MIITIIIIKITFIYRNIIIKICLAYKYYWNLNNKDKN